jgi:hypothetical protein
MLRQTFFILASLLLLSLYSNATQVFGTHADIFIPVLEMDPKSPIAGQIVTLTTVVTNKGNADLSGVKLSYNVDGVWIIDDVTVDLPARKSIRASFTALMPVNPGEHQLRACPDRESLGDEGDHCATLSFTAVDESALVVAILSPRDESVLRETTTIKVAAMGQNAEKVELYVQNQLLDTKTAAPFDFALDTTKYEDGQYRFYAIAYFDSGVSRVSSVKKYLIDNQGSSLLLTVKPGGFFESEAKVGQTVVLESDVTNEQQFKIAATFIVLVKDSNGFAEFLEWREEAIPAGETLPLSLSWIPEDNGKYAVEVFLWDTVENAVPLTDVMRATVLVN